VADPRDLPSGTGNGTTTQSEPSVRRVGEPKAPAREPRPKRSLPSWVPWAGWVVALIAISAAVMLALAMTQLQDAATLRAEAEEAGEVIALQITTFDGEQIDEWINQTRALATGAFAEDLASRYDQDLRDALRESGVRSVGEVLNSFVQDAQGDRATVFVIVRQTSSYPGVERSVEDELRMELTLQRRDGQWLASDVAVLTPTPPLSTAPGSDAPTEASS
jgi:Mce-associated membrane protein